MLRTARLSEVNALNALVRDSVFGLSTAEYSPAQLESSMRHLFGVDTNLIEDGTYYVIEEEGRAIACGGWSRRRTLFGGDQYADRSDDRLDPATEAARIRAFFVHPSQARRGLATVILDECARAAGVAGFGRLQLMSTLPGEPFYARRGFRVLERVTLTLPDGVPFPLVRMERILPPLPPGEGRGEGETLAKK
jgi:GNAT superfamily N-acetyltransferase